MTGPPCLWTEVGKRTRLHERAEPITTGTTGAQALDTLTATGRLMLAVIGAVGQAEREAMLERQRDGITKAKVQGRYKGRVPTVRRLKPEGVRPSKIADRLEIGRASVYRVMGEQNLR